MLSATNPENGTVSYAYNSDKTLATKTDAKNQQVQYTYDTYHRVTVVKRGILDPNNGYQFAEDTCQRETYSYDTNPYDGSFSQYSLGRLTAVQYKGGSQTLGSCPTTFIDMFSYSQAGAVAKKRLRITRSSQNVDLDATYAYDNEGRNTATQYPSTWAIYSGGNTGYWAAGPNLSNTYDSMGRLQKLTDVPSQTDIISNTTYSPAGQLLTTTGGVSGAPSETRTYNSLGQLTQLSICPNYSGYCPASINTQYVYSATQNNGKITSETDVLSGEQVTYTYDSLNRLASATSSVNPGWGQSYAYDGFGNLTTQTVTKGTAPSLSVSYDPATNRRTGESADANGNICVSGQWCSYDVENRLAGVATSYPQWPYVAYSYAPGNKRVWRGVWNGSTQTVDEITFWGANGQKLGTWALSMYYGQFVATATGTNYYFGGKLVKNAGGYITPDRLGSNGKYFPYGQERPSATTDGKEKFATYFRDSETGLDYAENRYHQPGMGRFMSPDPYKVSAGPKDPGSWNRYAYTGGDPINRTDRTGLDWTNNYAFEAWAESYYTGGGLTPGQAEAEYGEAQYCEETGSYCPPGDGGSGCYGNSFYGGGGCFGPDPDPDPQPPPPPPPPQIPSMLQITDMCSYSKGGRLSTGYTLEVKYQVLDQFGMPIYGNSALNDAGVAIKEGITTSGPAINAKGEWCPVSGKCKSPGSMDSSGRFWDTLAGTPFGRGTAMADQSFYLNGKALPVSFNGSTSTVLKLVFSPTSVTLNGQTASRECGQNGDPPR